VEEGFEEGVLILAVAVLVSEDLGGGVRLIAADAEVDADVAGFGGDKVVEGADLVVGGFRVFGQLVGAGAEGVVGLRLAEGERAVPVADFGPGVEGGPGDGGKLAAVGVLVGIFGRSGLSGIVGVGFGRGDELRDGPDVRAESVVLGDSGFVVGAPDLDIFVGRDFEGEGLVANDDGAGNGEVMRSPELGGSFGLIDGEAGFVLEGVADGERADREVLLLEIAVERGFAGDSGGHVHRVGGRRVDSGAVGLVDADDLDGGGFVGGGVAEGEDAELLRCSLGLDADDNVDVALAGAVGVHAVRGVVALEDEGLIGEGRGGGGWNDFGGGRRLLRGRDEGKKRDKQGREQARARHTRVG
jgi:hypothetical protein